MVPGEQPLVALVVAGLDRLVSVAVVAATGEATLITDSLDETLTVLHAWEARGARWIVWGAPDATALIASGFRPARMWDLAAVHRLLTGRWQADPARIWASAHGLTGAAIPWPDPVDLFHQPVDPDQVVAVRDDGYLDPEWANGGWRRPDRLVEWARLALRVQNSQQHAVTELGPAVASTARSESVAEVLAVELGLIGLPVDRGAAEAFVEAAAGPRPRNDIEAAAQRAARDAEVLRHAPPGITADLRSPTQVIPLLRSVGVDVPDTRAHRLERHRDDHPLVAALLTWRKAERVATTYGYAWLDEHLGEDGRLRGGWSASDGGAGRMSTTGNLHSMPAEFRHAVVAEPGHVFVRADLGQIEPRILAAVAGDRALARATQDDDLYLPVARALGVERPIAKLAVLGAMYGSTTGQGAQALRRLHERYPVAMAYLDGAARQGEAGNDLRTHGGRLIRLGISDAEYEMSARDARSRAAARGRYARNALVQGAAAEFFKRWAVTVRARGGAIDAEIVMCLHDELVIHVPIEQGDAGRRLLADCLAETARGWSPLQEVRFVADISVVRSWADAK